MKQAGAFEVWAARAWNVFNEGKPFSIVYPVMVLLAPRRWSAWRRTAAWAGRCWVRSPFQCRCRASPSRSAAGCC